MELEEAVNKLKANIKTPRFAYIGVNGMAVCQGLIGGPDAKEAIDTVLQELERLQKENEDKKTYEFGLIVGTKRERDWWQNKIREKIEEIKNKPNNPNQKVIATQIDASLIACLDDLLKEE